MRFLRRLRDRLRRRRRAVSSQHMAEKGSGFETFLEVLLIAFGILGGVAATVIAVDYIKSKPVKQLPRRYICQTCSTPLEHKQPECPGCHARLNWAA